MKTFRLVFIGWEMSILIGLEMNQSEHNLKTLSPTPLSTFVGDSDVGGNVMWASFFVMLVIFSMY